MIWRQCKKGKICAYRIKQLFYTMRRINPLGSTRLEDCAKNVMENV
ncbi:hypothetical protein AB205_0157980 [Aquarana catesbeiana]|uniref:Uncharacterized protein n=1 Tax=Aquarana catesbeiana TaxID=8400 RepID=A0A2G9QJ61_AQUCT|nr:hypothetical protein AB205_0157980 [Aquarana catesbeiana]